MTRSEAAPQLFSTVASKPPAFSSDEACAIAKTHFGLSANETAMLVSERDQNFLLRTDAGERVVLKIANAEEERVVTEFQLAALAHIEQCAAGANLAPRVVATQDGRPATVVEKGGQSHLCRIVTYLPGRLLADAVLTPDLCQGFGRFMGVLDDTLCSFDHPGAHQILLWDMQRALELKALLPHLIDREARLLVEATFNEFETQVQPMFGRLPTQIVHNDANPGNVLVSEETDRVVGVIDFGDMLRAPRVVEVAIACAYLRSFAEDPLLLTRAFVAGYHAVTPLQPAELDVLHVAIKTRLATTVAVMAWRASLRDSDDAYLLQTQSSEDDAQEFLRRLVNVPNDDARRSYADACAAP
ncbi:MAG: phosphotransferase [Pseudomonadota bacterium]